MADNLGLADEWAATFKVLGDESRLKLLNAIHYAGPNCLTVSELADATSLRVPTASAALRAMEATGIVTAQRDGRTIRYAIIDDAIHRLLHWIGSQHDTD